MLHATFGGGWRELALSPDGRKVAVVAHGEVFAAPASGGPAVRVTHTTAAEGQIDWSPDSRRLVYTSERNPAAQNVYLYDFATDSERPVTSSDADDSTPRFSPGRPLGRVHPRRGRVGRGRPRDRAASASSPAG